MKLELQDRKLRAGMIRALPAICTVARSHLLQTIGLRAPASSHKHSKRGTQHGKHPRLEPSQLPSD